MTRTNPLHPRCAGNGDAPPSTPLKGSGPGRDSIELLFSETRGDDDLVGGELVGTPIDSALTPVDRAKFGDNADYMVYLEREVKSVSRSRMRTPTPPQPAPAGHNTPPHLRFSISTERVRRPRRSQP